MLNLGASQVLPGVPKLESDAMRSRAVVVPGLCVCLLMGPAAWAGHTLAPSQQQVLKRWLVGHVNFRPATDEDCACAEDIALTKRGYGGEWAAVADYHPYVATGDFNSDGLEDFAVALVDKSQLENVFALVVFNGPLKPGAQQPAFMETGQAFTRQGLFFGAPRPKPYRLIMGAFESEGGLLQPKGKTYTWDVEQP
jgi:hypothetical protein